MDRKKYSYSNYRTKTTLQDILSHISKNKHKYLKREINKLIGLLVVLLIIFLIKLMNLNSTNNVIQIIDKSINYKVDLKQDTKEIKGYLVKLFEVSKEKFEEILYKEEKTEEVFNEIDNNYKEENSLEEIKKNY